MCVLLNYSCYSSIDELLENGNKIIQCIRFSTLQLYLISVKGVFKVTDTTKTTLEAFFENQRRMGSLWDADYFTEVHEWIQTVLADSFRKLIKILVRFFLLVSFQSVQFYILASS